MSKRKIPNELYRLRKYKTHVQEYLSVGLTPMGWETFLQARGWLNKRRMK